MLFLMIRILMTSVSVLIGITLGFLLKRHATEGKESLGKQKKHKIYLAYYVKISILCEVPISILVYRSAYYVKL